jgi:hypothetical protein
MALQAHRLQQRSKIEAWIPQLGYKMDAWM